MTQEDFETNYSLQKLAEFQSNSQFNKFRKQNFNDRKRLRSYPSDKTGCRFITVDAYRKAIPFYAANGFEFLQKDEGGETELMYYDLKSMYQ